MAARHPRSEPPRFYGSDEESGLDRRSTYGFPAVHGSLVIHGGFLADAAFADVTVPPSLCRLGPEFCDRISHPVDSGGLKILGDPFSGDGIVVE